MTTDEVLVIHIIKYLLILKLSPFLFFCHKVWYYHIDVDIGISTKKCNYRFWYTLLFSETGNYMGYLSKLTKNQLENCLHDMSVIIIIVYYLKINALANNKPTFPTTLSCWQAGQNKTSRDKPKSVSFRLWLMSIPEIDQFLPVHCRECSKR